MGKKGSCKIPPEALLITTYAEFLAEVEAFDEGERNLVIVIGPPGTGKSTAARDQVKNAGYIRGGAKPYSLYQQLYEWRNRNVVLDDADGAWKTPAGKYLLKQLFEVTPEKTLQYNSWTPEIRSGELPREFTTTTRAMIVANSWDSNDPDIRAIEDRGSLYYFAPSNREVHAYAGRFDGDHEIYEVVGEHLHLMDRLSLRVYGELASKKRTGERTGDGGLWMRHLETLLLPQEKRVALTLMRDTSFRSDHERAEEFKKLTTLSERTFYRYRDELRLRGK